MDIFSFLVTHAVTITAISTIVLAVITIWYAISTHRILKETQVARKINDIEYQLADVYLPMKKAIEDFKSKAKTPESYLDINMDNMDRHYLEKALREIKSRNLGIFDPQIMTFSDEFFKRPSPITLDKFLTAVNNKTIALKKERVILIQDGKEQLKENNKALTKGNIMTEEKDKREKEIEKRERLVQIFLIIGSFFVTYSVTDSFKNNIIAPLFTLFLFFIILYYIIITRTKNIYLIDLYAIISSFIYGIFMVVFVYSRSSNPPSFLEASFLIVLLSLIFSFSLISPERSDSIISFFEELKKKHPSLMKIIANLITIIALGWFFWNYRDSIF